MKNFRYFLSIGFFCVALSGVGALAQDATPTLPAASDPTAWFRENSVLSDGSVTAGFDFRWVADPSAPSANDAERELAAVAVQVSSRVWASDAPTREDQAVALRVLPFEVILRIPVPNRGDWAEVQKARAQLFQFWIKQMGLQVAFLQVAIERLVGMDALIQRVDILDADWQKAFNLTGKHEVELVVQGRARLGMLSDLQSRRGDLAALRKQPGFSETRTTGGLGVAGSIGLGVRFYERFLAQAFGATERSSNLFSDYFETASYGGLLEVDMIPRRLALTARVERGQTRFVYRVTRLDPPTHVPVSPPPSQEGWESGSSVRTTAGFVGLRFSW